MNTFSWDEVSGIKSNEFQTKTALDMEISLYRKLLESEEDRLGMATGG